MNQSKQQTLSKQKWKQQTLIYSLSLSPRFRQNCRQKVFSRGALCFFRVPWHPKNWQKLNCFIVFHVSIWRGLELCLGD